MLILTVNVALAEDIFKYNSKGKRDPFAPLLSEYGGYASDAAEASAGEDIRLESILWDDVNGSIAIVNGEIAKEGDSLGAVKVLKINRTNVVFEVSGESITINLNQ